MSKKPAKPAKSGDLQLGRAVEWPNTPEQAKLDRVPNPQNDTNYVVRFTAPEFTSLCPLTGLPDFGEIQITYIPDARCLELKSLKYYLIDFRNRVIFYEQVTNQILDDLVAALAPRQLTVVGDFSARGGIRTSVTARFDKTPV